MPPSQRQQIPSASALPNNTSSSYTDGPDPTFDTFWYSLHLETLENFDRERLTWRKMTDRLRQDIASLKADLAAVRAASQQNNSNPRQDSAFYGSANGRENDKVFFDEGIANMANEKLREFSVVSPRGMPVQSPASAATPDTAHGSGASATRKQSGTKKRLPSIFEGGSTTSSPAMQKRVSISEPSRISTQESEPIFPLSQK